MSFCATGPQAATIEAIQIAFPFDPGVTPTTVLPKEWDDDGTLRLPAVISAPDFGQMLLTDPDQRGWQGRLEGSRTEKTVDFIVELAVRQSRGNLFAGAEPTATPRARGAL